MNLMLIHRATAAEALLTLLAEQDRRVVSPWRALILLRRATLALPASSRRWTALPATEADLAPLLRKMSARGQVKPLPHDEGLYHVTVPYAERVPFDEFEVLFEIHPYAVLSHLSALYFHNLTYPASQGDDRCDPCRWSRRSAPLGYGHVGLGRNAAGSRTMPLPRHGPAGELDAGRGRPAVRHPRVPAAWVSGAGRHP